MITECRFKNFKALHDVSLPLERLTVIVGPNSAGKSTILQGLSLLGQLAEQSLDQVLGARLYPEDLLARGRSFPIELAAVDSQSPQHGFAVRITGWKPKEDNQVARLKGDVAGDPEFQRAVQFDSWHEERVASWCSAFRGVTFLRLDPQKLMAVSRFPETEQPRLGIDGTGFASVLGFLAGNQPDDFQSIQGMAREVVPHLRSVRLRRRKIDVPELFDVTSMLWKSAVHWGEQVVLDFDGAESVAAPEASEGTLLVLGLITALRSRPHPWLILLDDIDRGLHPRAQRELVQQLRKQLELNPGLQIICTTHSPFLLEHMEYAEIRLVYMGPDGGVRAAKLSDHPDYESWKDVMSPGEAWSTVAENWIDQISNRTP